MTIVREEENGNNGHHAGDVWRGGRCPSSLDSLAGALALRCDRLPRLAEDAERELSPLDAHFGDEIGNTS